jgi:hypothetical protein
VGFLTEDEGRIQSPKRRFKYKNKTMDNVQKASNFINLTVEHVLWDILYDLP